MGRLIPAGSGIAKYRDFDAVANGDEVAEMADESVTLSI